MKRARASESDATIDALPRDVLLHIMRLASYRGFCCVSRAWSRCATALPWWDALLEERDRYLLACHVTGARDITWQQEHYDAVLRDELPRMLHGRAINQAFLDELALLFHALDQSDSQQWLVHLLLHYIEEAGPLGRRNWARRDMRVIFVDTPEEPHRYKVLYWDGRSYVLLTNEEGSPGALCSVTTYHRVLFPPFVKEAMIARVLASPRMKDPAYRYFGMSGEQIGAAWDQAAVDGTWNHANTENYLNGRAHDATRPEFHHFKALERDHLTGKWEVYRVEMNVYSVALRIVGQVDALFMHADPTQRYDARGRLRVFLADHKFCFHIEQSSFGGEGGCTWASASIPDCNYGHYGVQLHWYMYLLEHYHNIVVERMALFVMHREQPTYLLLEVPRDDRMIRRIVAYRRSELAREARVEEVK